MRARGEGQGTAGGRNGDPDRDIDRHMLEMLVCPLTKTRLTLSADRTELISRAARMAFPIRKGVPLLTIDEARSISEEEAEKLSG